MKLLELMARVKEKMNEPKKINSENKSEIEKINKIEEQLKERATMGDMQARSEVKDMIFYILSKIVTKNDIDTYIKQYHINYYKNIYHNDNEDLLEKDENGDIIEIEKNIVELFKKFIVYEDDIFEKKLMKLSQIIYQELYGFSIIDELVFDLLLDDINTNSYNFIWLVYKGINRNIPNPLFHFESEEKYYNVVRRVVQNGKRDINAEIGELSASLICGYRVKVELQPRFSNHLIRIRITKPISDAGIQNIAPNEILEFVKMMVKYGRRNFIIIGDQGSGKTTALKYLIIKNIDKNLSKLILEETPEINFAKENPSHNVVEGVYDLVLENTPRSNGWSPQKMTIESFRLKADVIFYGEVRYGFEAVEVIKAMLRNARGSGCTLHSEDAEDALHRLRQLLLETPFYNDFHEAQYDSARAIDFIIHIKRNRQTGKRYIFKISESIANAKNMNFEVRDIFVYDYKISKYIINTKGISTETKKSCLEYEMPFNVLKTIEKIFLPDEEKKDKFDYQEL